METTETKGTADTVSNKPHNTTAKPSTDVHPHRSDPNATHPARKVVTTPPKATATPPEIVTDPDSVVMGDHGPRPKPGDIIYQWSNLPEDACGSYWVKGPNGKVTAITLCRDEH